MREKALKFLQYLTTMLGIKPADATAAGYVAEIAIWKFLDMDDWCWQELRVRSIRTFDNRRFPSIAELYEIALEVSRERRLHVETETLKEKEARWKAEWIADGRPTGPGGKTIDEVVADLAVKKGMNH